MCSNVIIFLDCFENTIHWLDDEGGFLGCLYNGTAAHYSAGLDVCESNIPHNAYYPVIDTQHKLESLLGLKRSVTVLAFGFQQVNQFIAR